jgi:hypothetical protein
VDAPSRVAEILTEGGTMYASVRKYDVAPEHVDEFMHRVDDRLAPKLEQMPGFVAYQVIDGGIDRSGEARAFAITLCQDRDAAERSAEIAAAFVDEELADLGLERLEATIGTVSVSRAASEGA